MINKSLEYSWLEVLNERNQLDRRMRGRLLRAQLGYEGELDFYNLTQQSIPKDWRLLHDLTFKRPGHHLQIDFLLITSHTIYIFEIKHFTAKYNYINGRLESVNGSIFRNIFYQVEKGSNLIQEMFDYKVPVEGQLVFMSEQDTVNFNGHHEKDYLKRWQLADYFNDIRQKNVKKLDVDKVAEYILGQTVHSIQDINFDGGEWVAKARKGIICEKCGSSEIFRKKKFKVRCKNCGHTEGYKRAVIRTICDYRILHYNKGISSNDLYEFMKGSVNYHTLRRTYKEISELKVIGRLNEILPNQNFHYNSAGCTCRFCVEDD